MLKLKGVVDKQRDELRAKVQEISTISKEVEAVRRHKHKRMAILLLPMHSDTFTSKVKHSFIQQLSIHYLSLHWVLGF